MSNPFGDEFDLPEEPESAEDKIEYDRWGRYANLPAIPGVRGVQPWTRVTTIAKVLEDEYYLTLWKQRQVIRGIAAKPEFLDLVRGPRFDHESQHGKGILNSIASQAMDEAGSYDGAKAGTKFHDLAERLDSGKDHLFSLDEVTEDDGKMLDAYTRLLKRKGLEPVPEYMERVVVIPELGVAGRLDRIYRHVRTGDLYIGDLKSQKTLDFGHISLCAQLASYANAPYILNTDTSPWSWEPMPIVNKIAGAIAWVPAIEPGFAKMAKVDLRLGWTFARAAVRTREWRKRKDLVTDWDIE